jgi:hypothetical protein
MTFASKSLEVASLVPQAWKNLSLESVHTFNPALISDGQGGFIMAYRFVSDLDLIRRIGICRLDGNLDVIEGSALELSDLIQFADPKTDDISREWFADPRLFELQGKIWMAWNDGNRSDGNHQFLVEINRSGQLAPNGLAREITITDHRRKNEKNWAFFEVNGDVRVVYSIAPHRVLKVDMSDKSKIICHSEGTLEWKSKYSRTYGVLRGGAQPVQIGDKFVNLVHSSFNMPEGREYVAAVYEYSATYPFAPVREMPMPLDLGVQQTKEFQSTTENKLNPTTSKVVYPTGLVILKDKVFISAGINDSELALFVGSLEDLSYRMIATQVSEIKDLHRADKQLVAPMSVPPIEPRVPLFWWYAKGSKMNATISTESFKFGNFGDDASVLLVGKLLGFAPRKSRRDEKKLLAVGSILHLASEGDIVWGSGLKSDEALDEHPGGKILVTAVRGPRTLKVLERAGWDTSYVKAMFDPGVLLGHVFAEKLEKFDISSNDKFGKIRIVPHFKDDLVFRRMYPELIQHFVSADNPPLRVLLSMLGAEVVISSSLHGIIFAESLGIPAIWVESPGGEAHFKYLDYYEGTGRFGIEPAKSVLEALKIQPPALPEFDFDSLLATFPKDEITGLARARMPYTEREMIGIKARRTHREGFEHSRSKSIVMRNGMLWIRGKRGTIVLAPLDIEKEYSAVRVTLRPARMQATKNGFRVKVSVEGGPGMLVSWPKGSSQAKVVQLPVSREMWNKGLKISMQSNAIGIDGGRTTLKNWGLSICITSIGAAIPD